jgi:hypothetical protein
MLVGDENRVERGRVLADRGQQVSRKLSPASTSNRVRSVATNVELPELPLASAQILTMASSPTYYF